MKTNIRFGGFYHSIHSELIDSMIENYDEEFENYKDLYLEYSKKYVEFLNDTLGINLKFIELDSPRYYNYRTDEIVVSLTNNDYNKISDYISDNFFEDNLEELVDNSTKSQAGYVPFYTYEEFKNDKEIYVGAMLEVICDNVENEWLQYYDLQGIYELIYSV